MSLNEAIDWWIQQHDEQPLPEDQRSDIRRKALETGHAEFAPSHRQSTDHSWKMVPLLWLRLFQEIGVTACAGALQATIENEQRRQRKDLTLLFTRRIGVTEAFQGLSVERYPNRLMKGFTTLELLLTPPLSRSDSGHWPYDQEWKAVTRARVPRRTATKVLGSPEYAWNKWPKECELVGKALAKEAKSRAPGTGMRLVTPAGTKSDSRPYATELRIPDLATRLHERHKSLHKIAPSVLTTVIRQAFVQGRRGRPSNRSKAAARVESQNG